MEQYNQLTEKDLAFLEAIVGQDRAFTGSHQPRLRQR